MFSVMTNIYNKKNKKTYLNGIFHSHSKTEKVFISQLEMCRCVHHRWHGTQRYDIQVLATHASTWVHLYSSLLQWSLPLGQRGHVAMVLCVFCAKYTLHSNHRLTVWYSNTQNDFSPGAAIFSLHTFTSPSGRNMNYNKKQLTGKNIFELFLLSSQVL